jgi:GntR family transcriptional regulator
MKIPALTGGIAAGNTLHVPSAFSPVDPTASDPLYLQLMQAIAADIATRRLDPGQRLPSERQICETHGVSRVTARRALRALVGKGLVESSRGRGWFVANGPISEPPNMLLSFSAMGRARGLEPSSRILSRRVRPATLDEADSLAVVPGADVFELERLRLLDGFPVAVDRSRVPLTRCPNLELVDFQTASLYDTLIASGGAIPSHADYTVEAGAASAEHAALLDLQAGGAVLVTTSLTFDQEHRPLELGHMVYRGDRYRFRARLWQRPSGGKVGRYEHADASRGGAPAGSLLGSPRI